MPRPDLGFRSIGFAFLVVMIPDTDLERSSHGEPTGHMGFESWEIPQIMAVE